jgi:hypothetical protein
MATIRSLDIRLIEDVFHGGYVLDFSNRTFSEFFDELSLNVDDDKYYQNGTSKANRLRTFLRTESIRKRGPALPISKH